MKTLSLNFANIESAKKTIVLNVDALLVRNQEIRYVHAQKITRSHPMNFLAATVSTTLKKLWLVEIKNVGQSTPQELKQWITGMEIKAIESSIVGPMPLIRS